MTKEQNENSNKPIKDDNLKTPKKFNFYWIYLIVGVLLLSALFFNPDYSKDTTWNDVQKMIITAYMLFFHQLLLLIFLVICVVVELITNTYQMKFYMVI